jgi:hypothetical protein
MDECGMERMRMDFGREWERRAADLLQRGEGRGKSLTMADNRQRWSTILSASRAGRTHEDPASATKTVNVRSLAACFRKASTVEE